MSEEENKAIEYLKQERAYAHKFDNRKIKTITTIALKLIRNQQRELDNLKEIEKLHQEENGKLRVEFEKVYEDNLTLAHELEDKLIWNKGRIEELKNELVQEKVISEYWQNRFLEQAKYGNKITISGDPETIKYVIDTVTYDYIHKDKIKEIINEYKNVKIPGVREFFEKIEKMVLEENNE